MVLDRPGRDDIDGVHEIFRDPRVWTHYPSLVHRRRSQTEDAVLGWIAGWEHHGLDTWVVRDAGNREPLGSPIIGYGGCSLREGWWNLGYRFSPSAQGRGLATEVARASIGAASGARPELPIIAYLVEHNVASARVAERVGLRLVHRAPDVGNPDPDVVRLVYADRPLDDAQIAAFLD